MDFISEKADDKTQSYYQLLKEFNNYKEASIAEKQQMKRQIEKCKCTIQKFIDKVEKKIDIKLAEERTASGIKLEKSENMFQKQIESLKSVLQMKDKFIEDLQILIRKLENEKKLIVETNTKMLLDINQDLERSTSIKGAQNSHSYSELLKMYQYLIEENNQIKKELYLIKKDNENASFVKEIEDKNQNLKMSKKHQKTSNFEQNSSKTQNKLKSSMVAKQKDKDKKPPKQNSNKK